ncbi:hypothetical protein ZIOFF_015725 [Zingiber officinale]|uniref:phosphoenolpyruvate carboxykinase (ATP) n=1 Tax=Zingiber officinale TaxID=94328 RepID=A0A8J5HEM6_ZINOF|nr:hypothetical protein ZIOFF_015725 [Zingiber officinale]
MTTSTSIDLNLDRKEMVILGTQYAGEMKKGLFGVMHYLVPKRNILSLHSSNNMGKDGDVALFFGLSGKCWLDEILAHHLPIACVFAIWLLCSYDFCFVSENGISNIEGGCYAKCIGLTKEKEPDIWNAIKFGIGKCPIKLDMHFELEPFIFFCPNVCKFLAVLENIIFDEHTREVDYSDNSITENTRASYPIEYIPNAKIPCVGLQPKNVILLACDAFGVLTLVSKLTLPQTMYHFISGYTALIAAAALDDDKKDDSSNERTSGWLGRWRSGCCGSAGEDGQRPRRAGQPRGDRVAEALEAEPEIVRAVRQSPVGGGGQGGDPLSADGCQERAGLRLLYKPRTGARVLWRVGGGEPASPPGRVADGGAAGAGSASALPKRFGAELD